MMLSALLLYLVPILFFLGDLENVKGGIELLSSKLCPGEQLTLMCVTNETGVEVLQWTVNLPSGETTSFRKSIPIEGNLLPEPFIYPTDYGNVVFNFSRTSDGNTYPLVTELSINEVNMGINGTEISCSEIDLSDKHTIIIHIKDHGIPKSPAVNITDYYFGMTNVTVTLEWTQESDVTYNVSIHPKVELEYTRENVLLVMIPYNISYHINVVASLCGQYSTTTTLVLNYATCHHHLALHQGVISDIPATVTDNIITHEGTTMILSCLSGLVLVGSNTSTCTENGQWEPDPREVECIHSACVPPSPPPNGYINFHSSESDITFVCQNSTPAEEVQIVSHCNLLGKWVPNPTEFCSGGKQSSEINILLIIIGSSVSSVICLLFLGFCCCLISTRNKSKQTAEMTENSSSAPVYEDLLPAIMSKENELNLKENVAYSSIKLKWHSNSPA